MPDSDVGTLTQRLQVRIRGAVQGVGFRPFVHRLASRHSLSGFVRNDGEGVLVEVEGERLDGFLAALKQPPSLARIDSLAVSEAPAEGGDLFEIRDSLSGPARTRIAPDAATCDACLADLFDPASRFYRYPFVACTQCGPRLTIARRLPYDRATTTMAEFPLCEACAEDYRTPASRRFHAETIACPDCGPRLSHSIAEIAAAIAAGQIVALKGIGGFHLMCDASNNAAVAELRRRKAREEKPFAVMAANADAAAVVAAPTDAELALLASAERPIVLIRNRRALSPLIAPGLRRIGVMLPYAPPHHLLFDALPDMLAMVATSANLSGEPLAVDDDEAHRRLAGIADLIVTHDRKIVVRADDSVMAMIDGAPAYLRRSRGAAPEPIDLGEDGPVVLGLGGHLKTTITVARGREAFVSQHIGDLDTPAAVRCHAEAVRHLLDILDVAPEAAACDLHPDFHSTRLAEAMGLPIFPVQHHAAHIAAIAAEYRVDGPLLGLALDGNGLGDDGGAWGGEMMLLDGAKWRRLGHLSPLALPGGDRAARENWRMGVAALAAIGRIGEAERLFPGEKLAGKLAQSLAAMPTTTSLGRLFDAAAALLGLRTRQSFEGQAAMELEALVRNPRSMSGGWRLENDVLDFRPLLAALPPLRGDKQAGADLFHGTLIDGLAAWAIASAARIGVSQIALGGGCMMNRVLAEGLMAALSDASPTLPSLRGAQRRGNPGSRKAGPVTPGSPRCARDDGRVGGDAVGLTPLLPRKVPANDGGLSLGQVHLARKALAAAGKDTPCASPFRSA